MISHLNLFGDRIRSEVVYRLLPALSAGGTVGIMATVLSRKFGMLAGSAQRST